MERDINIWVPAAPLPKDVGLARNLTLCRDCMMVTKFVAPHFRQKMGTFTKGDLGLVALQKKKAKISQNL